MAQRYPTTPVAKPPITEEELQSAIINLSGLCGWMRVHFRPALTQAGNWVTPYTGDDGFSDIVLARNGCTVIAELKNAKNGASNDQWEWLAAFAGTTVEEFKAIHKGSKFGGCVVNKCLLVALWRPKHWKYIEAILRTWVSHEMKPRRK